ncbi:MAG: DUF1365 domain-containing protein [Turneriella sp.]
MREGIYETKITHVRHKPERQSFTVRGYSLCVDVSRFDGAGDRLRLLSFVRPAWHRFRRRDFSLLADTSLSAVACARNFLRAKTGIDADRFFLLAHPAIAGYIFNPVSFFFCLAGEKHVATIVEVNNTFGEQKHYILPGSDAKARYRKNFYVSPFISPFADFAMQIPQPGDNLEITINTVGAESPELLARMSGKRFSLTDLQLLKFAVKYPFYTVKVIALIHYYALRLFLQGVPYFPKKNSDAAIIHRELRSEK